jgi:hypothetical protein
MANYFVSGSIVAKLKLRTSYLTSTEVMESHYYLSTGFTVSRPAVPSSDAIARRFNWQPSAKHDA